MTSVMIEDARVQELAQALGFGAQDVLDALMARPVQVASAQEHTFFTDVIVRRAKARENKRAQLRGEALPHEGAGVAASHLSKTGRRALAAQLHAQGVKDCSGESWTFAKTMEAQGALVIEPEILAAAKVAVREMARQTRALHREAAALVW